VEIFKYLCSIPFEIVDFYKCVSLHVIDLSGINDESRYIETVYGGTGTVDSIPTLRQLAEQIGCY